MRRTWVAVAVICAGMVPAPTSASDAPAAAGGGGEHWYGYVSMEGMGSHKLPDGGQFTNHDKYVLNAPEPTDDAKDPEPGKLNITIDTVESHPDPDPLNEGCWTLQQVWTGGGVVDAALSVQSNVGGQKGDNYIVHVDALAPVQVNIDTHYGGTIGGEPCSAGDTTSYANLTAWVIIHSARTSTAGSATARTSPGSASTTRRARWSASAPTSRRTTTSRRRSGPSGRCRRASAPATPGR